MSYNIVMYLFACYIEHPVRSMDQTFTYYSEQFSEPGVRVTVDFNHRTAVGFVEEVRECEEVPEGIKPVLSILDEEPLITPELHALAQYMKDITVSTSIACYQAMLPAKIKPGGKEKKAVREVWVRTSFQEVSLSPKQLEAFLFVRENEPLLYSRLRKKYPHQAKALIDLGALIKEEREREAKLIEPEELTQPPVLSKLQREAVSEMLAHPGDVFLLHGMTGSGKTEVYLHLAKDALDKGKQVLILVPEIALTPQMIERVRGRFGSALAIYHSGLNPQEKYEQYRMVRNHAANIVVGTRSAVFLPFSDLGLIVMDEEQDGSYKQENQPSYHCRDIAIWRGKHHGCSVILGSATPSLESFARALKNVYHLVSLPERINENFPEVRVVSLRESMKKNGTYILTDELKESIDRHLKAHHQVILLLNRRGYHTLLRCRACQEPLKCVHCDITLSYHHKEQAMVCHSCGYTARIPRVCPSCGAVEGFSAYGYGTERLAQEVLETFEGVRLLRMDADTVSVKNGHENILKKFGSHEADILVGTQMIAKGLDYPDVTLVGILNGDEGLSRNDYRSCEVTFDLLMQAAGRSGRAGHKGEVVLQVFDPGHYAITDAARQDYLSFFREEMKYRHAAQQPPYTYLISITACSLKEEDAEVTAGKCMANLKGNFRVLGVIRLPKRRDRYSFRILLKGKNLDEMRDAVRKLFETEPSLNRKDIRIDVNPMNLE